VGFKEAMQLSQVHDWVRNRDSAALMSALQTKTVLPGDAMLVPAGLPHTVQEGVFVLELQEPTDLSILLEWQGFDVDGDKDGHLNLGFDVALQALDTSAVSPGDLEQLVVSRADMDQMGLTQALPPSADPYFRLHRLRTTGDPVDVDASFSIVLITSGSGTISSGVGNMPVKTGDALLMPYAAGDWSMSGDIEAMVCRPPASDAAVDAP
jgi:mannose-6-phosphate isomerase